MARRGGSTAGAADTPLIPVPLNSNGKLFAQIRDFNIRSAAAPRRRGEVAGRRRWAELARECPHRIRPRPPSVLPPHLQEQSREIQRQYEERPKDAQHTVQELQDFVKKIPHLKEAFQELSIHIHLTERVTATTNDREFRERWQVERGALAALPRAAIPASLGLLGSPTAQPSLPPPVSAQRFLRATTTPSSCLQPLPSRSRCCRCSALPACTRSSTAASRPRRSTSCAGRLCRCVPRLAWSAAVGTGVNSLADDTGIVSTHSAAPAASSPSPLCDPDLRL